MPEQTVWRGTSSQWRNMGAYILWALFSVLVVCIFVASCGISSRQLSSLGPYVLLLLIIPIPFVLARYLKTRSKVYELTTERLKISEGVFSKVTDTLELYRVKDIETRQPFLYRIVGVENVQLNTSDTSTPFVFLEAVPCSVGLADRIRNQVEIIQQQKGVREVDIE